MTHTRIRILTLLAAALFVGGAADAQTADAPVRICYVDLQTALNDVEEGASARTQLEADFARRQTELDTAQQELETWMEELEASLPVLTPEARAQRMQEYQERVMALQQEYQEHQRELAQAEATATGQIFERMVGIVQEYAEENGCTLVLDKSTILYAPPGADFTATLVESYNERY